MLNALFDSEARVKLLNHFLLHPESKYCASQIVTDLKININTVNKEIEKIQKIGLIIESPNQIIEQSTQISAPEEKEENKKEEKRTKKNLKNKPLKEKGTKKYFEVNKGFILYPEIKALFVKAQILSSQKFILSLEKTFQPKLLILSGFFTNYPEAQTDILIVGQVKRPIFLKLISDLEKDLGHEINFTILDENEYKYRKEIMDIFLYTILEGKTVVLIDKLSNK